MTHKMKKFDINLGIYSRNFENFLIVTLNDANFIYSN